jgi:cytochrome c
MSRSLKFVYAILSLAVASCGVADDKTSGELTVAEVLTSEDFETGHFSYGELATAEQIAGWDIDIRPDGLGLPPGGATAEDGEMLYEEKCASCHGSFGEGVGRYPVLAGGEGSLTEARPEKTVGSFWPYASTLWDYIHRAMPFTEPESLSDTDVYAITAYVLYLNDLVEYDFELTQDNLAEIEMPNKDGFFLDDRPDVVAVRCMENCKEPGSVEITSEPQIDEAEPVVEVDVAAEIAAPGKEIYERACALCHASGVGEAPIPGDAKAWAERIAGGRDMLINSAISGKGIMPPKGGQLQLSDEEVISAVDFIISLSAD